MSIFSRKKKYTTTFVDNKSDAPISKDLFSTVTRADSYLYDKYQLRPYNPDVLWQKRGDYSLYDDMMQDDQIPAVLMLKKLMIIDCDSDIEVYEIDSNGEKKEFKEGKSFLEWNLDNLPELFSQKQLRILTAKEYGFSLTEKIFKFEETNQFGKKIILKDLRTRAPHSFDEIEQDEYGNIVLIRQDTQSGVSVEIDPAKFIHYINGIDFDNPFGVSDLNKGVYRNWWSKDAIIKFWNIALERFGSPFLVGKYPQELVKEKTNLKNVLKNVQSRTSIVIPDGVVIEAIQAAASGKGESQFERAINYYNMMMARKMLVPDLMGFGGKNIEGGSYALGKEHFGVFYDLIEFDRKYLARLYTKEICQPLIDWNYGKKYKAVFRYNPVDDKKKDNHARLYIDALKTGKIETTDKQKNHFFSQIDYPEITEEEMEEQRQEKEQETIEVIKDKEEQQPNNVEKTEDEVNEDEEKKKENTKTYGKYYRELNKYEKKIDLKSIESGTKEIEDKYMIVFSESFKILINGLIDDIKRRKIIEKKRIDLVNGLSIRGITRIEKDLKDMYKESYKLGVETVERPKSKKMSIIDQTLELTDEEIAQWFIESASYVGSMESGFILGKVKPILFESIKGGTAPLEAYSMIETALKGYNIYLDASRIENIVRTNTSKAFNEARAREFYKLKNEIVGYFYSAILDNRTSLICETLDSNAAGIYRPDQLVHINPPNHFQCRSIVTAVFRDELGEFESIGFNDGVSGKLEKVDGDFYRIRKDEV